MQEKKLLFFKIALLIWTIANLAYGFKKSEMPLFAYVLWIVPVFLLLGALSHIKTKIKVLERLMLKIRRIPFIWSLVISMTTSSYIVAKLSLNPDSNHILLFGIWLVGVLSLVVWAILEYIPASALNWKHFKHFIVLHKWELILVTVLTLVAFLIRVVNLAMIPGPLNGDDGENTLMALEFKEGTLQNMFGVAGSFEHPAMYFFISSFFHRAFIPAVAQRLPSAIIATLTIPVFYIFIRHIWKKRLLAFCSILYLIAYHFHHHYSRMALPNIADPFFVLLALYFAWRSVNYGQKNDFILMGIIIGLTMYSYLGARLSLFVALGFLMFFAFWRISFWKKNSLNMVLAFLSLCLVLLPIWLYWDATHSNFMRRYYVAGVLNPGFIPWQVSTGGHFVRFFYNNAIEVLGYFGFHPEKNWPFYRPPIPLVDKLSLPFFLLGIFLCLIRFWRQPEFLLLIMFFGSIAGGGVFTTGTHSGRLLTTTPAVAAFTALGIIQIGKIFQKRKIQYAVIFLILSLIIAYNIWFYFNVFSHGRLYADRNLWMQYEIGKHVEMLPRNTHIFFYDPVHLYTSNPPLKLAFRNYRYYDVSIERQLWGNPPTDATPRIFIFARGEREPELNELQEACPGGTLNVSNDDKGKLLFKTYEFLENSTCLPLTVNATS